MADTVRVRTAGLLKVLSSVLPMVDREPGLSIHGILLETGGGVLTATATDRFVLGHARTECQGALAEPVIIWRKGAKQLVSALRDEDLTDKAFSLLGVDLSGDLSRRLYLGTDDYGNAADGPASLEDFDEFGFESYAEAPCDFNGAKGGEFPRYTRLFKQWAEQEPATGPVAVKVELLARFGTAADLGFSDGQMPRWRFGGHKQLVRVDIGDWFAGLAAPYSRLSDLEMVTLAPIGLPGGSHG